MLYALTDPFGTVIAIADASGNVVERYVYDALGNAQALQANGQAYGTTVDRTGKNDNWKIQQHFSGSTFNTTTHEMTAGGSQYGWDTFRPGQSYDAVPGLYMASSGRAYNSRQGSLMAPDYAGILQGHSAYDPTGGATGLSGFYDRHAQDIAIGAGIALGVVATVATAGVAAPMLWSAGLSATAATYGGTMIAAGAGGLVSGVAINGGNSYVAGNSASQVAMDAGIGGFAGAVGGFAGGAAGIGMGLLSKSAGLAGTALLSRAGGALTGAVEGGTFGFTEGFIRGGLTNGWSGALHEGLAGARMGAALGGILGAALSKTCFVAGTEVIIGIEIEDNDGAIKRLTRKELQQFLTKNDRSAVATLPQLVKYVTRPIEALNVGDDVLTRDEHDADGDLVLHQVEEVFTRTAFRIQKLTIRSSTGIDQTLQTTAEHPAYVLGKGWVSAGKLQVGDTLQEPDGSISTIIGLASTRHLDGIPVYNFRVAQSHTYFVREERSTAEPVWVHNSYRLPRVGGVDSPNGGGFWSGERGNSVWYSFHPDVIDATGGYGVPFMKNIADFSAYSRLEFEVGGLTGKGSDFGKIYKALAGELGFDSAADAQRWLAASELTPHHSGGNLIQLLDSGLHSIVRHTGGAYDLRLNN